MFLQLIRLIRTLGLICNEKLLLRKRTWGIPKHMIGIQPTSTNQRLKIADLRPINIS